MKWDYDLVVIGGGAAGLSAAGFGVTLGARTLMIESAKLGGDCTWTGCIPSKTLLQGARAAHYMARPDRYGLTRTTASDSSLPESGFAALMDHVRAIRQQVYEEADSPEVWSRLGVDLAFGRARFVDPHTIEIDVDSGGTPDKRRVTSRYFVIATGGRTSVPPIDGLTDYLTNETLFELQELPRTLGVIGAGPIGVEMAQAFARLGSSVTMLDLADRMLPRDDAECAAVVAESLKDDGVQFLPRTRVQSVSRDGSTFMLRYSEEPGASPTHRARSAGEVCVDQLLVATGRRPNIEDLSLDAAGVQFDEGGITIDNRCRTNIRHIFATGDVTGRYQFTHMSEHMSKVAVTNMLLKWPARIDEKHVPWVTFSDPELAHVGATQAALDDAGTRYRTYRFPYSRVDRAITDGVARGLIKVYARERDGRIFGADVAGHAAGEVISELAVAMKNRITLRKLSDTIHPYPTYGLGVRRVADQWYVQKYSPRLVRVLQRVFGYRGPLQDIGPDDII